MPMPATRVMSLPRKVTFMMCQEHLWCRIEFLTFQRVGAETEPPNSFRGEVTPLDCFWNIVVAYFNVADIIGASYVSCKEFFLPDKMVNKCVDHRFNNVKILDNK